MPRLLTVKQRELLCLGYSRAFSNFFPIDIVQLYSKYYTDGTREWKFDSQQIEELFCVADQELESEIFDFENIEFQCVIYPQSIRYENQGWIFYRIRVLSMPSEIKNFLMYHELLSDDIKIHYHGHHNIDDVGGYGLYDSKRINLAQLKNKKDKLESFTLKYKVAIHRIEYKDEQKQDWVKFNNIELNIRNEVWWKLNKELSAKKSLYYSTFTEDRCFFFRYNQETNMMSVCLDKLPYRIKKVEIQFNISVKFLKKKHNRIRKKKKGKKGKNNNKNRKKANKFYFKRRKHNFVLNTDQQGELALSQINVFPETLMESVLLDMQVKVLQIWDLGNNIVATSEWSKLGYVYDSENDDDDDDGDDYDIDSMMTTPEIQERYNELMIKYGMVENDDDNEDSIELHLDDVFYHFKVVIFPVALFSWLMYVILYFDFVFGFDKEFYGWICDQFANFGLILVALMIVLCVFHLIKGRYFGIDQGK